MATEHLLSDAAAERAVLGAVLLHDSTLQAVLEEGLCHTDFSIPAHRYTFEAMCRLKENNVPLDIIALTGHLQDRSELSRVGGTTYLTTLSSATPSVLNAPSYARTIREKSTLRSALRLLGELKQKVGLGRHSADDLLEELQVNLSKLRSSGNAELKPASSLAMRAYEEVRRRAEMGGGITGLRTGFADLDRLLSGLQPTDFLILAARPAMGKTALALNITAHAALNEGKAVAFFSLEMGELQLLGRLMACHALIPGEDIRTGRVRDWDLLHSTAQQIGKAPLYIDESCGQTINQVRAKCRSIPDLSLVVIDYLQLMRGERNDNGREQEIASVSRGLKALAKELGIPVIALAQLNRAVEHRADKRPMMSDLRESGQIEQDADVIMFLYREEVYSPTPQNVGKAELLVRKHRNGATGDIKLHWNKQVTRFSNMTRD